jgi:hypothetical protein
MQPRTNTSAGNLRESTAQHQVHLRTVIWQTASFCRQAQDRLCTSFKMTRRAMIPSVDDVESAEEVASRVRGVQSVVEHLGVLTA